MSNTIYRYFEPETIERASESDATPKLRGYAIVFNSLSQNLGGFVEKIDSKAIKLRDNVFAFYGHDQSQPPLASTKSGTLKLRVDPNGLYYEIDIPKSRPDVFEAAQRGDLQMSFGARVTGESVTRAADGTPIYTLTGLDVFEVSPCAMPAYTDTSAVLRSIEAALAESERTAEEETAPETDIMPEIKLEIARALNAAKILTAKITL